MSISPIITFKAGRCEADLDASPPRVTPIATPGYFYIYSEDELLHVCWRAREASLQDPLDDLVMIPMDAYFIPYLGEEKIEATSPVNGRIFVLKFRSSALRHFFWLQSRPQTGDPKKFSTRDLRLGQIVNSLLQGEELDMASEQATLQDQGGNDGDDDATMEDVQDLQRTGSGGAGADATGGDVREEGEGAREGGADGGRATDSISNEASTAIQNFINSFKSSNAGGGMIQQERTFTTLPDLLPTTSTIPMIEEADPAFIEDLLVRHLPPSLVFLEHQVDDAEIEADEETLRSSVQALSEHQQRDIVRRVLRSPQFSQGLTSLNAALRDGGLPVVSQAVGIEVKNGGYTGIDRHTPLSGGDGVEAFLNGVKDSVKKSNDNKPKP